MAFVKAFFQPPLRLRALPDRQANWLRPLWMVLFGLAILTVMVSTIYAVRASYFTQPVIHEFGLDFEVTTSGELLVGTYAPPGQQPTVPATAKVVSIDGKPVSPNLQISQLAKRLDEAPGSSVKVGLRQPDGKTVELTQSRHKAAISRSNFSERNIRIWTRLATALLACSALLACGMLLALRRPNDPVAMLLAFAFVGMVATIDPPMQ